FRGRIRLRDRGFDLFGAPWIAAFEPLLLAIGAKLRIVERRHHGRTQRSEAVSGNIRRSHERTTQAERRGGGDQQRLVGVVLQEIKRERHAFELPIALPTLLTQPPSPPLPIPAPPHRLN